MENVEAEKREVAWLYQHAMSGNLIRILMCSPNTFVMFGTRNARKLNALFVKCSRFVCSATPDTLITNSVYQRIANDVCREKRNDQKVNRMVLIKFAFIRQWLTFGVIAIESIDAKA